ncbi:MAG: APC family permease [Candidatus Eremiobacteraeota bacterium]|nr:APC family permease [Candidatus Eremiobacteraeota bacterium]MBV9648006.1 APC family permease [Candidatus Eremiobacteraeota bacterium]
MTTARTAAQARPQQPTLRRAVTAWGSFSWGYSDVGADIFVGLGLVLGAAAGASNIAFLFAGIVYVCIGLAYTELAATYPVAGGGQYFVFRGLGDIFGFIAGWAVLLDFTIDIVLFAWSCIDYLSKLPVLPFLAYTSHPWTHFLVVFALIVWLAGLNIWGVRESSAFNELVSALDVVSETAILFFGFLFAFHPDLLVHTMTAAWPNTFNLMNGVSLAIISFVGLESISQAAQETQRPASIIPRTSISLILTILIFALSYSNLSLGMQPWHPIPPDAHGHQQMLWHFLGNEENNGAAVAVLASYVPYWGAFAALYVPVLGAILLLISSNSGVFGSSRIAYAMSRTQLLPSIFQRVSPTRRTPVVSIAAFCGVAVVELIFAALPSLSPGMHHLYARLFRGEDGITFLGDLYAFGAATSYSFVFIALIALRFNDAQSPRRFKMPINIPLTYRGRPAEFPVVAVIGFIGIASILVFTMITHEIGRIAGPSWIILGLVGYLVYRHRKGLPVFRSQRHDWRKAQVRILQEAGELELMDEYLRNVKAAEPPSATQRGLER